MAERQLSSNDAWVHWVLNDCHDSSIPYVLRYFEAHKQRLENLLQGYHVPDIRSPCVSASKAVRGAGICTRR